MFAVKVSCPGKVILHGEHSVVYKKPALATAIGLRTKGSLREIQRSEKIEIKFKSIDLNYNIPLSEFQDFYKTYASIRLNESEEDDNLEMVKVFVKDLLQDEADEIPKRNALMSTLYLLTIIFIDNYVGDLVNGFQIEIESDMNIGAGLGSSASFSVCLAACFLSFVNHIKKNKEEFANIQKQVSRYAFLSEKIMHIIPSGVDNTVCTFGNIIKFATGKEIKVINVKEKIPILLINTQVSRSTAQLVQRVAKLKDDLPRVMFHIFDAMGELVEAAVPVYENYVGNDAGSFKKIERFIQMNNDLLRVCGVSHKSLEDVFSIAMENEFCCKLTGAGGGGYAIIVLPFDYKNQERFSKLCDSLTSKGYECVETVAGDDGLVISQSDDC